MPLQQKMGERRLSVWDVDYDDSAWERATLPHTVREEALMCSGGRNYQGEAWYRKRLRIERQHAGMDLLFELEGAMQRVDAWLDGKPLGMRMGGFLPMAFDLTGLEPEQEHVLVLRADNSDMADVPPGKPQGALDFCYFGGLYRDAWLHVMHPVHFTFAVHAGRPASGGLFVHYRGVSKDSALVDVDAHFENCSTEKRELRVQLLLDGQTVYTGSEIGLLPGDEHVEKAHFKLDAPRLWHPHHPNLYTLTARLLSGEEVLDEMTERIGVREFAFRPDGFYINGEKLFLNGANRHQEYPYVGFALPDRAQRRDVRLLRDAGMIAIRTGHYPQDKAFMDACDEVGLLCVIPTPGWQFHPASVLFDELSYENTRRLIRMNRNHPSACLWEPILNETDYPEYFAKKQLEIVAQEMGQDACWCGCDSHYAYAEQYPVHYGHAGSAGKPRFVREYGDNWTEQFGPMKTLRRVRRGANVSFYMGGEKALIRSAQEHFEAYVRLRMDEDLSGAAMWAGIDHNRGYDESEGAVGMLDLQRLPKFQYHLYRAQQSMEEAGAVCFIANDWTEASPRDVHVYTNAPQARLLCNGKEIAVLGAQQGWENAQVCDERLRGAKLPEGVHPPIVFCDVPWEAGVLRAEALAEGEVVAAHEVRTPGAPERIALEPMWAGEHGWTADGADLLLVHAYIVDGNGTVVKDAEPMVRFTLEGDAQLAGDGQAWTGANPMRAEAGAACALLRAGYSAGKVVLCAESEGLEAGRIVLETQPDLLAQLPGPECAPPAQRPVYAADAKERFSLPQSLKLEDWFNLDLGRNKPCSASSSAPQTDPNNVNQGEIRSPWIAADGSTPQWWQVDLEQKRCVTGLTLKWLDDGLWYDFSVHASLDGAEWEQLAQSSASGQGGAPVRFPRPVDARFLRVVIHSVTGGNPAGILLAEVHGEADRR
ncbi:MAG: glycoside hydrolase family 2 TIM barrel-domain containing protein [Eubacteriales bacterium]|nr:glycoside hydrolase family 2 TIM barrel-domain containing protein [Eubacteriales bacterium]